MKKDKNLPIAKEVARVMKLTIRNLENYKDGLIEIHWPGVFWIDGIQYDGLELVDDEDA